MPPALECHNLHLDFAEQAVLQDFSLSVPQGDIVCLLGPSGCGKTTALKTIAGLLPLDNGQINIFADTVASKEHHLPPQQRNVGFIFQDYALFPHLSVADNIRFGLTGIARPEQNQRIEETLALVELSGLADRFPHQLSGGQQQRVAVARALAPKPSLLLMDEPFSNIDAQVKHKMLRELRQLLKQRGVTTIIVTHAKEEAFMFADHTAVMLNGKIQQQDSSIQLLKRPNSYGVAKFMDAGNILTHAQAETLFPQFGLAAPSEHSHHLLDPSQFSAEIHEQGIALVENIHYTGQCYLMHIQLQGAEDLHFHLTCGEQPCFAVGSRLQLKYLAQPLGLN